MIRTRPQCIPASGRSQRVARRVVSLSLIAALMVPSLPFHQAKASHPCMIACVATAPAGWAAHQALVQYAIGELDDWIEYNINLFRDAVVKLANQGSNDGQNLVQSMNGMEDHQENTAFANDVAESFVATATEIRPSASGCATNQMTNKVFGVMLGLTSGAASYLTNVGVSARAGMVNAESSVYNTAWANAAGTAGNLGRLDYLTDRYTQRIARYNNSATTGQSNTPSIAADADLTPLETIMAKPNLSSANDLTAAQDVVFNLAGDAVQDPMRGQALIRGAGRSNALMRNQESARLNLATTILTGMVERRRNNAATGQSEQEFAASAASYAGAATRALDMAKADATQGKSANLDKLVAMIGDTSRQLFVMQTFMEQWAAIKAISLAMDVKQSAAGETGVSTLTINQ